MTPLLYKNRYKYGSGTRWRKIDRNRFTGEKIENSTFFNCDFSGADLSGTEFIGCQFYDRESQKGCNFSRAMLKDAIFKSCDLSMADFRNSSALGIEIRHCRAQGADFRGASFMNMITTRTWFCSAYITNTNLSYANFSKVVLEKCELWENRWIGARYWARRSVVQISPAASFRLSTGEQQTSHIAI